MSHRLISLMVPGLAIALMAGCGINLTETAEGAPLARQVTASDQCGIGSQGLTYLSEKSDLAQLSGWPMQNLSMKSVRALDFDQEHMLIVGLGQKPTGGFGLTLADSEIDGGTLEVTVFLRRPPADAIVSQALTTPCAVLAISPDHWDRLEVNGNGLETLRLER